MAVHILVVGRNQSYYQSVLQEIAVVANPDLMVYADIRSLRDRGPRAGCIIHTAAVTGDLTDTIIHRKNSQVGRLGTASH